MLKVYGLGQMLLALATAALFACAASEVQGTEVDGIFKVQGVPKANVQVLAGAISTKSPCEGLKVVSTTDAEGRFHVPAFTKAVIVCFNDAGKVTTGPVVVAQAKGQIVRLVCNVPPASTGHFESDQVCL